MVQNCVVNGCKSESFPGCGKSFHRFPNDETTRSKWIQALQTTKKISKFSVVCSLHFKKEDFLTQAYKKLKSKAVPSIFPKVKGVVVGADTLEEKERAKKAEEINQVLQEIETEIIEDETPNSKHPMILPVPQQSQENPLEFSSVTSMKSVQSIQSNSVNVAIGPNGFLYILPSSCISNIPQQLNPLETCSNMSQISNSDNNGLVSSAEKRTVLLVKQNCKRPRHLQDDSPRSNSDDDVILIGDEEAEAQEQVVKYPIRIDSKVDWEDKIPMDIISFVDSKSSVLKSELRGKRLT